MLWVVIQRNGSPLYETKPHFYNNYCFRSTLVWRSSLNIMDDRFPEIKVVIYWSEFMTPFKEQPHHCSTPAAVEDEVPQVHSVQTSSSARFARPYVSCWHSGGRGSGRGSRMRTGLADSCRRLSHITAVSWAQGQPSDSSFVCARLAYYANSYCAVSVLCSPPPGTTWTQLS